MMLVDQVKITRQEAMLQLGVNSRTTMNDYCNCLGLPAGLRWFTEEEFCELKKIRAWCERGGRKKDYFKYKERNSLSLATTA